MKYDWIIKISKYCIIREKQISYSVDDPKLSSSLYVTHTKENKITKEIANLYDKYCFWTKKKRTQRQHKNANVKILARAGNEWNAGPLETVERIGCSQAF